MIRQMIRLSKRMRPAPGIHTAKARAGRVPLLILQPEKRVPGAPALLWIHGGGYFLGMKEMVYLGRAADLAAKYGVTVISPGYRLALRRPYPAALADCYRALLFTAKNACRLGIDEKKIMVGGESAGGGLAAALCLLAKDRGEVQVAWQFPLYPMLSCRDTASSRSNHGRVWNTRRNHLGWRLYLRGMRPDRIPAYASPSLRRDLSGLPPAYTFVGDGEPFYAETLDYISRLNAAGVEASADVYHTDMHAFDMLRPDEPPAKEAIRHFEEQFARALSRTGT